MSAMVWIRTGCRALGPVTVCGSWVRDGVPCHACVGRRVPTRLAYVVMDGSDGDVFHLTGYVTPQRAARVARLLGGRVVYLHGQFLRRAQEHRAAGGVS